VARLVSFHGAARCDEMSHVPKVSVAMASYNHAPYVATALQSVLEQSFQDFEIVVTDDGSADGTAEEARQVRDPRISVKALPTNVGGSIALNSSILRCRGLYVAVLNSDDIFLPGKLERQVRYLDAHPEIGALFGYPQFIDECGIRLAPGDTFYGNMFDVANRTRAQWLRHFFFQGNALCHPSVLIRRKCYDAVGFYNPALAQLPDLEMWVRLLHRFDIHVLPEPLVGFRILEGDRNASAGRPDAIARVQWEWLHVLPHYLTLDKALLARVFTELPDTSTRKFELTRATRYVRRLIRRASVVRRSAPARNSASGSLNSSRLPITWHLGRLACCVGKSPHVLFGLDLMHRAAVHCDDPDVFREFIRFSGAYDIFDVLSKVDKLAGTVQLPDRKTH
jgi:glycosyltransferase involved in cell wall biosynthesis